jgi:hypothetical protein
MIAVAGIALMLEVFDRRSRFQEAAREHDVRGTRGMRINSYDRKAVALNRWHLLMAKKYQRAARYPWLPVAPDPPEPQ